jgi:hypothetical protein
VGIEGLTHKQLRALGRGANPHDNAELLQRLQKRGFVVCFNSIIVHPRTTVDDIAHELDALAHVRAVHFDLLSMAVYPGTQAYQSLLREGRLTGGMLSLRFEPSDPRVNRFRAALIRMRLQGTGRYGPNLLGHDVAVNLALAKRLGLSGYDAGFACELDTLVNQINRIRLHAYRAAFELACSETTDEERQHRLLAIMATLGTELTPAIAKLLAIQGRLEGSSGTLLERSNLMMASAIAASFILCLVPLSGCGGQTTAERSSASSDAAALDDSGSGTRADATASNVDAAAEDVTVTDSDASPAIQDGATDSASCVDAGDWDVQRRIHDLLREASCQTCDVGFPYGIAIDAAGSVVAVLTADWQSVPEEVRRCYIEALSNHTFPCLAGEEMWADCYFLLR